MAKKFSELEKKMTDAVRTQSDARYRELQSEMPLQELRHARQLTQAQLADLLNMTQAAVSKMERNTDMYISTLKHFVEAMGGDLDIRAVFPDGEVKSINSKNSRQGLSDNMPTQLRANSRQNC